MKIDRLILGEYETNCYVLRSSDAAEDCLIVDTGLDARALIDFLQEQKLNPVAVVLTHGHIDHIAGAEPQTNLSAMGGMSFRTEPEDFSLDDRSVIEQAGIKLLVLHTPGHTPGGISLYSKDHGVAFVGDTIFAESIGRTDFPGGSMTQLLNSVKERLFTLPDETKVHPGHGPATTIAHEKQHNPFLQ
jgi:glyoxylase-like metal-dependent hydrolase (beta-lactamase superfamily II)